MMKLSAMKKVVETVDGEWRSSLAEKILERWGYDKGSVFYFRSSANFIFVFKKDGRRYFLRFNDSTERELSMIESEIKILLYLGTNSLQIAQPVKSFNDQYIEIVETEIGIFYAVVFEALQGKQFEIDELEIEQFSIWGAGLGKLHSVLKVMPEEYSIGRKSWKDHLEFVEETLPKHETAAKYELDQIKNWINTIPITKENFGLIHYDFELDNLRFEDDIVGMLDFDDCANYWFVADIAFALRDIDGMDLRDHYFQKFIEGYSKETEVDQLLLKELPWFKRFHNVVLFAKLLRSIDLPESLEAPDWLRNLRDKLVDHVNNYRDLLEIIFHTREE